jgi:TrmH family RNA methyltransferase
VSEPDAAIVAGDAVWLALEAVRDPGNLGTIVRTVDAVGAVGVILVGTCVDPYSRECVRATMGSIFDVAMVRMAPERFVAWAATWRGRHRRHAACRARGLSQGALSGARHFC